MSDYFPAIGETVRAKVGDQTGNTGTVTVHDLSSVVPLLVQFGNRGPARWLAPDEVELVPEKVTEAKVLCSTLGGMSPKSDLDEFNHHGAIVQVDSNAHGSVWLRLYTHDGVAVGVWLTPEAWEQIRQVEA